MSDFFYSSVAVSEEDIDDCFGTIYKADKPCVIQFHGPWGSLGVSRSRYNGFDPIETDCYICVVLGGPVLYFEDNHFLSGADRRAGTRRIFERWQLGVMKWDEDLSGPFVVLVIDKAARTVVCITDLMLFIPVYQYQGESGVVIGTHVDALAQISGQKDRFDEISIIDFVLHGIVTHPYTIYDAIRQCHPAAEHNYTMDYDAGGQKIDLPVAYWVPREHNPYQTLSEAALDLRNGVERYVERITESMTQVAQFISGGEDSRALSGLLPSRLQRDAYIFLDSMNREGQVAKKIATAYSAQFVPSYRDANHYLRIMAEASSLIGSGHQFKHAHSLGFHRKHNLDHYSAVFGGYLSDSLLKGEFIRKLHSISFMPQLSLSGETRSEAIVSPLFSEKALSAVVRRRRERLGHVQKVRPSTAHEWFALWPIAMKAAVPNLYSNRRLFASYEVFTSKEVVKISAAVPVEWKLNRRLFHRAFKLYFQSTKWYMHADGRFPYFSWWINCPIQFMVWSFRKVTRQLGFGRQHQGPWASWKDVTVSPEWHSAVASVVGHLDVLEEIELAVQRGAFSGDTLGTSQKVNLLQVCSSISKMSRDYEQGSPRGAKEVGLKMANSKGVTVKEPYDQINITVIVPIYQHWAAVSALFEGLGQQTFPSTRWEFLLVDNGSDSVPDPDDLPHFVTLLSCEKPGSYSARNRGLTQAQGELIVFTDADCRPCPSWLEQLWDAFQSGGKSQLVAGGVEVVKFEKEKPSNAELYDMAMGLSQSRYVKRGYAVTANLAIPKAVFSDIGAFDDSRFSGGDAELCLRARKYGYTLSYCESALVYHPARQSWGEIVQKVRRVKGGKVMSGAYRKRANSIVRTYIPPVWAFVFVIRNKRFSISQRMLLLLLQSRLWVVEMAEVARLMLGKTPERR